MEDDATVSDQAQASAEEAASFAAGFDGTTENAPAKADAATETTAEARTTAEEGRTDDAAPGATAAAAPAASEYVQITREEWERFQNQQAETQAELGRVRDQANGQFGGLQRVLAQAQAGAEVTAEDFAGLREIGLGDVADALARDLGGVLKKAPRIVQAEGGAAPVDAAEVRRQVMFDLGVRDLKRAHPDYAEIRDSAEFQAFIGAKPEAERTEFFSTIDPDYAGRVFTEFKTARKKATDTAAAATASMRRDRFAAAETPRGAPAQPQRGQTERDAFKEGFATG